MSEDLSPLPAIPAVVYSYNQLKRARELLTRFYSARRSSRFYPPGHRAVEDSVAELRDCLETYFAEGVDVVMTFFEDELMLGEQLLAEESILFDQLIRDMVGIGAGSVAFLRGLELDELARAMHVLSADAAEIERVGGADIAVFESDAPHVKVSGVTVAHEAEPPAEGEERKVAVQGYRSAIELMRDLEHVLHAEGTVYAGPVRTVVRGLLDNVLNNRFAMLELAGLHDYDEYTFYHSVNVAVLSLALGVAITRDNRFLTSLGTGALLHDIGKTLIDVNTLNKPGPFDPEEWEEMRRHPLFGAEQAARTPGLDRAAIVVILEHHLRVDGRGYPQRFPQRPQHLASRIVAIADAYDAMTSQRSYSGARLPDEAVAVLAKNARGAFDPRLVRLFVETLGCYPPRSVVRLASGETGVVLRANPGSPLRPHVRLFADPSGTMIAPRDIDLSAVTHSQLRIERCLDTAGLNVDVDDFLG